MLAFSGVRVLDLTHVLAGPFSAYQLALLGADVIKIENPYDPDQSRENGVDAALNAQGMGVNFQTQAANKRSLTLDLKQPRGRDILLRLAADADVLVENYRPGAMEALGCGYTDLAAINPSLVYCSISAFGQTGPRRSQTAYDIVIQAASGLMMLNGTAQTGALRLGAPVIDYATGMMGAFAISTALLQRTRTSLGQHIDLAMFDVAKLLMSSTVTGYLHNGAVPEAAGNRLPLATQGVFKTADGLLMIAANNFRQQRRLWTLLGSAERLRTTAAERQANRDADHTWLAATFLGRTAAEWETILQNARVPAARVRDLAEAMDDPQSLARGQVQTAPAQQAAVLTSAFRMTGGSPQLYAAPRRLGADSNAVLEELGCSPEEIESLRMAGVI